MNYSKIFRKVVDRSEIGIWSWELSSNALYWNDNMFTIFGKDKKNFTHKVEFFFKCLHPIDKIKANYKIEKSRKLGVPYEVEYRVFTDDQKIKKVYAKGFFEKDSNNINIRMSGICLDITEYGSIQNKMEEMNAQIECAYEYGNIGFWTWDVKQDKAFGDKKMHEIFNNYKNFESFMTSVYPEDRSKVLEENNLEKIKNNNGNYHCEYRVVNKKKGILYIDARGKMNLSFDGEPDFIAGVVIDKTEEHKRINQLTEKNNQLQRFSYMASHDLQEPLRKIRGYLNLIDFENLNNNDSNDVKNYAKRIDKCTASMQKLIDDLLTFCKLDNKTPIKERINLKAFFNELLDYNEGLCDINVENDIDYINFGKTDFWQIFQNLISNSIKFKNPNDTNAKIKININKKNKFLVIIYQDKGIGIDPRFIDKVFDSFAKFHSKAKYEGTGIGMYIVKTILKKYNGFISVESKLKEGVSFSIQLPIEEILDD